MSEHLPLPRLYRPRGARIAAGVAAVTLVVAMAVLWLLLSADARAGFTVSQRITLLGFLAAHVAVLYAVYRTSARADANGLTVVNGYRVHRYEWAEVVRVSLGPHRPWALLDLADGSTASVMAIQSADKQLAARSVRELAWVLAHRSSTDHDT